MQIEKIKCSEHPHEYITNFCAKGFKFFNLESCLVPLCATCICKHTEYHSRLQTSPEY